jgi:hypothetical protein
MPMGHTEESFAKQNEIAEEEIAHAEAAAERSEAIAETN